MSRVRVVSRVGICECMGNFGDDIGLISIWLVYDSVMLFGLDWWVLGLIDRLFFFC